MEKNGAISQETPCAEPGCCRKPSGEKIAQQTAEFPKDAETADRLDGGLMKDAADAVKQATRK